MVQTWIAMLRGINVSGQKKVPMKDLKAMFEALGFPNVRTYIQSGNVLFQAEDAEPSGLGSTIEKKIAETFGFEVPVILRKPDDLATAIRSNPFKKELETEQEKMYVIFLGEQPDHERALKLKEVHYEPEQFVLSDKEIYLYMPAGYGNAKLNNNFFENRLKVKATTRNWRTVNELLRLSRE
jgi:uncharacterized protein (DUF1697 family)